MNNKDVFDQKKFENLLPGFFSSFMDVLTPLGLIPTLVGGGVRDFLMTGKLGHDWDMEITHETLPWSSDFWKDLGKALSKLGRTTYLPYDIIRLEIDSYQIELSPPRVESFTNENHHKNFTVSFDFKLPFAEAVKRRDFTLNAMGIRFESKKKFELLDPLEGQRDLSQKILHPCSKDFSKDPVRFLRALRFKVKYGLEYSKELAADLEIMNATGFSSSYLWSEMQKSSKPLEFLMELISLYKTKNFSLPVSLDLASHKSELTQILIDPSNHESWMVALEWLGFSSEDWQKYFNLSSESSRRLGRWAQTTKEFQKMKPEIFHGEFDDIREKPEFKTLFDWYFSTKQILQKHPELPLLKMIESYLPEWIHLYRFEVLKDVKHIDPPFRAKYQVWNICQRL